MVAKLLGCSPIAWVLAATPAVGLVERSKQVLVVVEPELVDVVMWALVEVVRMRKEWRDDVVLEVKVVVLEVGVVVVVGLKVWATRLAA